MTFANAATDDTLAQNTSPHSETDSLHGSLVWHDHLGYGIDVSPPISYEGDYWEKYRQLDKTGMGEALTKARVDFVKRHTTRTPVDVGIGGGAFVEAMGCLGYDVNSYAIQWLKDNGKWCDIYQSYPGCLTFWDSLEHIPDLNKLLLQCGHDCVVFVSIPIFSDVRHCLVSKHYKPGEHIWYFTHEGFLSFMEKKGFKLLEFNNKETILGRDGIESYAFRKRG